MAKTPGPPAGPRVAVHVVLLTPGEDDLMVYLRKRKEAPFAGRLTLPGTLLRKGERTEDAAQRVLDSVPGIQVSFLSQLYTFSDPERDPRGHTVAVAYFALFPTQSQRANPEPLEDAWIGVRNVAKLPLAFDHTRIVAAALERLTGRLDWTPDAYHLLPNHFTIPQLQRVHELILGEPLKPDVFTKRVLRNGLRPFQTRRTVSRDAGGRPARLYRNPAQEVAA